MVKRILITVSLGLALSLSAISVFSETTNRDGFYRHNYKIR